MCLVVGEYWLWCDTHTRTSLPPHFNVLHAARSQRHTRGMWKEMEVRFSESSSLVIRLRESFNGRGCSLFWHSTSTSLACTRDGGGLRDPFLVPLFFSARLLERLRPGLCSSDSICFASVQRLLIHHDAMDDGVGTATVTLVSFVAVVLLLGGGNRRSSSKSSSSCSSRGCL